MTLRIWLLMMIKAQTCNDQNDSLLIHLNIAKLAAEARIINESLNNFVLQIYWTDILLRHRTKLKGIER